MRFIIDMSPFRTMVMTYVDNLNLALVHKDVWALE